MTSHSVLLLPGSRDIISGGYIYAEKLLKAYPRLRSHYFNFSSVVLTEDRKKIVEEFLSRLPRNSSVLIDGLLGHQIPEILNSQKEKLQLYYLCHHPAYLENPYLSKSKKQHLYEAESESMSCCRAIFAVSPTMKSIIGEMLPKSDDHRVDILLAPPGIEIEFQPEPRLQKKLEPSLSLLAVGNLIPRKNHEFILSALSHLKIPAKLTIIGQPYDPDYRDQLLYIISQSENVQAELIPGVSQSDLMRHYRQSDFFLSSSLLEGYGMAIREAYACGLPTMVLETETVRTVDLPRHTVVLPPQASPEDMAKALMQYAGKESYTTLKNNIMKDRSSLQDWKSSLVNIADTLKL